MGAILHPGGMLQQPARPPPLLTTKLHPPAGREQTVMRGRLVERLQAPAGTKLTVLAAPAGYGKTTLLGGWREWQAPERPIAWLTVDEGDNDPVVLWSYVTATLADACPALEVTAVPGNVDAATVMDAFLPRLINAIAAFGPAALVLDDFHELASGPARDSLAWFIDRVPSTFQFVIATRSEPGLPLGALRAHGELVELRAAELGFDATEADALLNDLLGLGLERTQVEALVERTEGWPAGIYLAGLSLQATPNRSEFVSRFSGGNRHVVDFLVDEVLNPHDPDVQTLMLHSSVLGRMCGPLCDAVLEVEGSEERLHELARTNLFVVPLDDRGEWYRFHQLFAQLLRVELEHREPGLAPTLHRRALAWHLRHGTLEEALEHAVGADSLGDGEEGGDPAIKPKASSQADLSEREVVVLRMLTGPLSERDIGRELYVSHNTVHSHTRSIFRKLGASSRSEAIRKARSAGLI
jgi:LuxR family transcriptional regulator, maltose regulon positive regulatory protein